jgi:hypothetical protein
VSIEDLKSSVWRQYNDTNSFRQRLAECCVFEEQNLVGDDKELYALMKAKLTKRELKLFAMDSAKISDDDISKEFEVDADELTKMKYKLYKKLKQDKTRLCFRASKDYEESV